MEIIKVLIASVSSAAVVTAGIAAVARPLANLARHLLDSQRKVSSSYDGSIRPVVR